MSGEHSAVKRLKQGALKQDFQLNIGTRHLEGLKGSLKGCVMIPCRCLKFKTINGAEEDSHGYPFSEAFCSTTPHVNLNTGRMKEYAFGSFFDDGLILLHNFVNDPTIFQHFRPWEKGLLQKLLEVVKDEENTERLYKILTDNTVTEHDRKLAITHHLISKLSLNSTYTIDKSRLKSIKPNERDLCPCCKEKLKGTFGDTGFGHSTVWHGSSDVLINEGCIVFRDIQTEGDADDSFDGYSSGAKKNFDCNSKQIVNQLIAQSVCFSFLINSKHTEFINTMVPLIGVSQSEILISLYDAQKDVFIQSTAVDLIDQCNDRVSMEGVITLWLVLNYQYFSSFSEHAADFVSELPQADFFKLSEGKLDIYKGELCFGNFTGLERSSIYRLTSARQTQNLEISSSARLILKN